MEIEVYNIKGEKLGKQLKLDDAVFNIDPNDHAIYLDVKQFMANKRQGTHKTKERNEVTGSTKKIKRQKGTGTARAGDIKSPIFVGGGRTFGPKPRNYGFKLNKKLKKIARKSALSYKFKDDKLKLIEDFDFDAPKTKSFVDILQNFNIAGEKVLFVFSEGKQNIILSTRNLKQVKVTRASDINTYDLVNANSVFISESSVKEIEKNLSNL